MISEHLNINFFINKLCPYGFAPLPKSLPYVLELRCPLLLRSRDPQIPQPPVIFLLLLIFIMISSLSGYHYFPITCFASSLQVIVSKQIQCVKTTFFPELLTFMPRLTPQQPPPLRLVSCVLGFLPPHSESSYFPLSLLVRS